MERNEIYEIIARAGGIFKTSYDHCWSRCVLNTKENFRIYNRSKNDSDIAVRLSFNNLKIIERFL